MTDHQLTIDMIDNFHFKILSDSDPQNEMTDHGGGFKSTYHCNFHSKIFYPIICYNSDHQN